MGRSDQPTANGAAEPNRWDRSHGTYLAGQAHIDGADDVANQMELRWGVGRLRLLVSADMRERFDRQRYLYAQAVQHGDLEAVIQQSRRMIAAYTTLDRLALEAQAQALDREVFEVVLDGGRVAAVVRTMEAARFINAQGRDVTVYTMEEIGHLLSGFGAIVKAKQVWPGAAVEKVYRPIQDPLNAIGDPTGFDSPLDGDGDEIPF